MGQKFDSQIKLWSAEGLVKVNLKIILSNILYPEINSTLTGWNQFWSTLHWKMSGFPKP